MAGKNIPVLDKSIIMLQHLSSVEGGSTSNAMAKSCGMSIATCYRAIQTLLKHNWIYKNESGKYELSHGILDVSAKLSDNIEKVKALQPILDSLSLCSGLSCKLSIRNGVNEFITMVTAQPDSPIVLFSKVGSRFPLAQGTVGALMLRNFSNEEIAEVLKGMPDSLAEKHNPEIVYKRIDEYRKNGYCFCGQIKENIHTETVSAPLDGMPVEAVISLLGFPENFEGKEDKLAKLLKNALEECKSFLHGVCPYTNVES